MSDVAESISDLNEPIPQSASGDTVVFEDDSGDGVVEVPIRDALPHLRIEDYEVFGPITDFQIHDVLIDGDQATMWLEHTSHDLGYEVTARVRYTNRRGDGTGWAEAEIDFDPDADVLVDGQKVTTASVSKRALSSKFENAIRTQL